MSNDCNKSLKQVLSFFSNLTSVVLILRIALYTYMKSKETDLVKMFLQVFSDTPNWLYKKT